MIGLIAIPMVGAILCKEQTGKIRQVQEAQILPRYWAPLFVPYRTVNEMAPRLYFGRKVMQKTVGGGIYAGLALYRAVKNGQISEEAITSLGFKKLIGDANGRVEIPGDDKSISTLCE